MEGRYETLTGILLGLVLLISITNEFVGGKINSNLQKQIEQDIMLSKSYGETSVRWLEVNEMLQRNFALVLQGFSNKTVEESGKFKKEDFSEQDWSYWRDKTVITFWEHRYRRGWKNLRNAIDDTNNKKSNQDNFVKKNKKLEFIEGILRVVQICLIILSLYLYWRIIRPQGSINSHNKQIHRNTKKRVC